MPAAGSADAASSPIYPHIVWHYRRMGDDALIAVASNLSVPGTGDECLSRELARRLASALEFVRKTQRRQKCGWYGTSCSECDAAEARETR